MLGITNYANNLRRIGYTDLDLIEPFSDRLIDALVLHGDATAIVAGIRAEIAAGASHVGLHAMGADPIGDLRAIATAARDLEALRA
jgi:hypothetical protein